MRITLAIQLRRDDHARLLMKPTTGMTKVASAFSEDFSIVHKQTKLLELSKSLKSSAILGENRVIATHVAIARRIENGRTLFVMLFFKGTA
jgi:hypothetical protein